MYPYFRKRPETVGKYHLDDYGRFSAVRPRLRSMRIKNYAKNSPADLNLRLPTNTDGAQHAADIIQAIRPEPAEVGVYIE